MLMWRTGLPLRDALGQRAWRLLSDVDDERPESLRAVADVLDAGHPKIASEWRYLPVAFGANPPPRQPSDDELVRRYVAGEIGDRTVKWVTGWDHWQLIDACLERGLPPMPMAEDEDEDE
ncbi:hypothetical protein ACFOYU_06150 [Microvirga sp. GCM10011540]|uniref:hypothetical protein n=1 Tax=Microvirga sp. GCM10011540 TaxID=3317338 RepID=UPI0036167E9A